MSLAAPDDHDDEEEPADAADADAELPDDHDDHDDTEGADGDESAVEDAQTVELAWVPEGDDPEKPLPFAVEANASMLDSVPSEYELQDVERTVEGVRDDLDDLREENRQLRERIDSLEGWKGDAIRRLNETSENVRLLLSASDLDMQGSCPECGESPLEKITGFGQTNRIECSGEDCDHVAAELE